MNYFRILTGAALAVACGFAQIASAQTSGSAEIWATQGEGCSARADESEPWTNTSYTPECRASFVLDRFTTLDEKLLFLGRVPVGISPDGKAAVRDVVAELGLPQIGASDGPAGLTAAGSGATALPSPITVAASFDRAIAARYGALLADEFRASGRGVILGPAYDIARNWRFGRLSESMGEDPFLTAEVAASQVGALTEGGVLAMMKHYAVYAQDAGRVGDQPSGSGAAGNNIVSERAMREIYLPGFRAGVQRGGAGAVMCSFPRINGVYACENAHLFDILKREWGFDGYAAPDFPSAQRSITRAVLAGLDAGSIGPSPVNAALAEEKPLRQAVPDGEVPMARIDDMILRRLVPAFRIGLMDNPPERTRDVISTPQNRAAAADILASGSVLLRNQGGILPFGPDVTSIAVIGLQASDLAVVVEQGSPFVAPAHFQPAFPAIAERAGEDIAVTYSAGTLGLRALPAPDPEQFATPDGEPGFLAQYYSSADLEFPQSARAEEVVEDPSLAAAPAIPGLPRNNRWSVRYDSVFTPDQSGLHRFSLHGSGSARLWIGGELMGEFAHADFGNALFANVELPSLEPVAIRIEYTPRSALRAERMEMFGMEMGLTLRFGHAGPDNLIRDAAAAAREADVAVVFVGELVGEGMDRTSLELQADQDRLIDAVARANPNTVVILNTGGPVAMPWLDDVAAVMEMWLPGDAFGPAVAALLFGDSEPRGRLPVTFPADASQGAATLAHQMPGLIDPPTGSLGDAHFDEGVFVGYRYFDRFGQQPLFPFGHGLSYGAMEMELLDAEMREDGSLLAQVIVRNSGDRVGTAVPQLYLAFPPETGSAPWQLKGFASVTVAAGEEEMVEIAVPADAFQYWDSARADWQIAGGTYALRLGASSRDVISEMAFEISP
ncbi:glycoside hydrolase family 3 C-terminal domain-containing protein [Alteraurantiacibacter aestuarii]|uniref:beta-glucosidase n=1 Tax=Alteraurantiacibacter aestuarii TaxID=650004 RepID=UPI0031DF81EF